jgi:hypothetical protein
MTIGALPNTENLDSPAPAGWTITPEHKRLDRTRSRAAARKHRPERFQLATDIHDEQIRRLLRDNPMPGPIRLSMEREPNYFAGSSIDGAESHSIVAIENDRAICAGSASARQRFVNGSESRVGYLSGLRLDHSCHGRASILLRGFQRFRDLHREYAGPPIYLMSILSRNQRAIRFLERNLPEMPTCRRLGEFAAFMIRCRARRRSRAGGLTIREARQSDLPMIAALLNAQNRQQQFAPVWTAQSLGQCAELKAEDFRIAHDSAGCLVACAAIWDQRPLRQTVVRGYSPRIAQLRPVINFASHFLPTPRIPDIGQVLPFAFASHVAAATPVALVGVLDALQSAALARGIKFLTTGFDTRDPRLQTLRSNCRGREYRSRLYAVHWDDGADAVSALEENLLNPEVALL